MPEVGQNYVLSPAQDNDAPVQEVFVLGNDEAICDGLYLKRVEDADPIDHDSYHMWQIAKGDVDAISATVAPVNLTVYTGGEGYSGVIGDDGKFVSNDFPEMGFYFCAASEHQRPSWQHGWHCRESHGQGGAYLQ